MFALVLVLLPSPDIYVGYKKMTEKLVGTAFMQEGTGTGTIGTITITILGSLQKEGYWLPNPTFNLFILFK